MEVDERGNILNLWPRQEFRALLIKEKIRVKKTTAKGEVETIVNLADYWLQHKEGRQFERLVYAMPGSSLKASDRDYNGWLGFTVEPKEGNWAKNHDHLLKIICSGDESLFRWLMNWLAALVQQPGRHGMVAPVFHGGPGIGKGHAAAKMIGSLFFKQQFIHLIGADQLTGRFNDHLSGKVFVYADEATWGGDVRAAEKLKGLITESIIPIERKFISVVEETSTLHVVIASNNDWPIAVDPRDRRYTVFNVSSGRQQDDKYFAALLQELDEGGRAAMLWELLHYTVDWPATRHPHWTRSKGEISTMSLKPIERWWFEKLRTGKMIATGNGRWPGKIVKDELHADYMTFLETFDKHGRSQRATQTELGLHLKKLGILSARLSQQVLPGNDKDTRKMEWDLPTLTESRIMWLERMGWDPGFAWEEYQ